jgi:signal transduction histidine kinase
MALVVHQDVSALKEAEYLKDEFIGVAAHELRNPLGALKGFADTLVYQTARGRGPSLPSGSARPFRRSSRPPRVWTSSPRTCST